MDNAITTRLVYFDESGDDGVQASSSETFVLTSLSMEASSWQNNYNVIKDCRSFLKKEFGFHTTQEMHIKNFLTDKNPYRKYGWTKGEKQKILKVFINAIGCLDAESINVIIDKNNISHSDYDVLKNALTYNVQRIENSSNGKWNYILITDKGRIGPMRRTAREIRVFNPIPSAFEYSATNKPIKYLIEDLFEKDSEESYMIQVCDFIAYFVHLFYKSFVLEQALPNRVLSVIDSTFIANTLDFWKEKELFNLKANSSNKYGFVIYPKK